MANPQLLPWELTSFLESGHLFLLANIKALHSPHLFQPPAQCAWSGLGFLGEDWSWHQWRADASQNLSGSSPWFPKLTSFYTTAYEIGTFSKLLMAVVVVQLPNHVRLFATRWTAAHQASLSPTISWSLPKFLPCISDAIQPSHPLSSSSPSDFNLSQHQGLFQGVSCSRQVAKVWELHSQCPRLNGLFKVMNASNQWQCSVHFWVR